MVALELPYGMNTSVRHQMRHKAFLKALRPAQDMYPFLLFAWQDLF
jgi:hypothetical protein